MLYPTSTHDDEEVDKLYEEVEQALKTPKTHYNLVIGDFNAKIGLRRDGEEEVMGQFCSGLRNDRGDKLIDFAISNRLKVMNRFFKKKLSRRWTWRSPDGKTKNEIDFILTNKPKIIQDVTVINKVNTGSDHRMIMCKVKIDTRLERIKLMTAKHQKTDLDNLTARKQEFQLELQNRFQALEIEDTTDLDLWNDKVVDIIHESSLKTAGKEKKTQESKISDSTKLLMEKRRNMKKDGIGIQNVEYTETCKTVRKKLREDIRKYNTAKIQETIENNRSLKKTKQKLTCGKQKITSLLDKTGEELTDQDMILKRIEEFYEELYNSNVPVNLNLERESDEIPEVT